MGRFCVYSRYALLIEMSCLFGWSLLSSPFLLAALLSALSSSLLVVNLVRAAMLITRGGRAGSIDGLAYARLPSVSAWTMLSRPPSSTFLAARHLPPVIFLFFALLFVMSQAIGAVANLPSLRVELDVFCVQVSMLADLLRDGNRRSGLYSPLARFLQTWFQVREIQQQEPVKRRDLSESPCCK